MNERPLDFIGTNELVGRAEVVMTYYFCPKNREYTHVVDIVKQRGSSPSRHGFRSLFQAHLFMQQQPTD